MLAERSGVPREVIIDFENGTRALETAELAAIRRVLESVGVEFVEDGDGLRARLRSDPRPMSSGARPIGLSQADLARAAVVPVTWSRTSRRGFWRSGRPISMRSSTPSSVLASNSPTGSAWREATEMTYDAKRRSDVAARRAALLFEREQQSDQRVADEEQRHSDMLDKTARLREQRLAREAAEAAAGNKGRK